MGRLQFGRLKEAWQGEAADFTPLLAEQMDAIGAAIGVDLISIGNSEVQTTGGRRIDIVAQGEDGSDFVIENQYGEPTTTTSRVGWPTPSHVEPAVWSLSPRSTETSFAL